MRASDVQCKRAIFEMRDLLKDINQKLTHLIEQNRMERCRFVSNVEDFWHK